MSLLTLTCQILPFPLDIRSDARGSARFLYSPKFTLVETQNVSVDQVEKIIESLQSSIISWDASLSVSADGNIHLEIASSPLVERLESIGLSPSTKSLILHYSSDALINKDHRIQPEKITLRYCTDDGQVAEYAETYQSNIIPSEKYLEKYNSYIPLGFPSVQAEEFVVYPIRIADNIVNRSFSRWTFPDLQKMANMICGIPVTLDHDWDSVNKSHSLLIDFKIEIISPDEIYQHSWLVQKMGVKDQLDINQKIVKEEGYISVIAIAAIPITSPIAQKIRFSLLNSVSLGGFEFKDIFCPICKCSFMDKKCPHSVPTELNKGKENVAPYYERIGIIDLGEVSFVLIPNLPAAGLIQRRMQKYSKEISVLPG